MSEKVNLIEQNEEQSSEQMEYRFSTKPPEEVVVPMSELLPRIPKEAVKSAFPDRGAQIRLPAAEVLGGVVPKIKLARLVELHSGMFTAPSGKAKDEEIVLPAGSLALNYKLEVIRTEIPRPPEETVTPAAEEAQTPEAEPSEEEVVAEAAPELTKPERPKRRLWSVPFASRAQKVDAKSPVPEEPPEEAADERLPRPDADEVSTTSAEEVQPVGDEPDQEEASESTAGQENPPSTSSATGADTDQEVKFSDLSEPEEPIRDESPAEPQVSSEHAAGSEPEVEAREPAVEPAAVRAETPLAPAPKAAKLEPKATPKPARKGFFAWLTAREEPAPRASAVSDQTVSEQSVASEPDAATDGTAEPPVATDPDHQVQAESAPEPAAEAEVEPAPESEPSTEEEEQKQERFAPTAPDTGSSAVQQEPDPVEPEEASAPEQPAPEAPQKTPAVSKPIRVSRQTYISRDAEKSQTSPLAVFAKLPVFRRKAEAQPSDPEQAAPEATEAAPREPTRTELPKPKFNFSEPTAKEGQPLRPPTGKVLIPKPRPASAPPLEATQPEAPVTEEPVNPDSATDAAAREQTDAAPEAFRPEAEPEQEAPESTVGGEEAAAGLPPAEPSPEPVETEPQPEAAPGPEAAPESHDADQTFESGQVGEMDEEPSDSEQPVVEEKSAAAPLEHQPIEWDDEPETESEKRAHAEIPDQDAMQAVFLTEEPLTIERVVALCGEFPGVESCILVKDGAVVTSIGVPDGFDLKVLSEHATEMVAGVSESIGKMGLGETPAFTLHTDRGVISLFPHDELLLMVKHRDRSFVPGVKVKLASIIRQLSDANLPRFLREKSESE